MHALRAMKHYNFLMYSPIVCCTYVNAIRTVVDKKKVLYICMHALRAIKIKPFFEAVV